MAQDDWRIRIELPDEEGVNGFLDRLGLTRDNAEELAEELRHHRLAVSRDGNTVFVYTGTGMQAEQANRIVEGELRDAGLEPERFVTEHWLHDEERWDDEPVQPDVEEDLLERGYAPWEVRVETESLAAAHDLAEQLRAEGFDVSRAFTFVIVGAADREQAVERAGGRPRRGGAGGGAVSQVHPPHP